MLGVKIKMNNLRFFNSLEISLVTLIFQHFMHKRRCLTKVFINLSRAFGPKIASKPIQNMKFFKFIYITLSFSGKKLMIYLMIFQKFEVFQDNNKFITKTSILF